MRYITVTKLEYSGAVCLQIQGLTLDELNSLKKSLTNMKNKMFDKYFEVDIPPMDMLNLLSSEKYGYKIVGQSMAMEHSDLGGRAYQTEKVIWTLETNK